MSAAIDAEQYPRVSRYLAGLPAGFGSYPECLVKTEVHESVRRDFPPLMDLTDLPPPMVLFLDGAHRDPWMSEVLAGALSMLVRDVIWDTDAQLCRWRFDQMSALFSKPLYRVMMHLLSPTLIFMNATKRWAAFHKGSTLTPHKVERQSNRFAARATLSYPAGLFNETFARLVATTYEAALSCSRARDSQVRLEAYQETSVTFAAAWTA